MKKFFLISTLLLGAFVMRAEGAWMLVTDSGQRVVMNNIGMLVAVDNEETFTVVLNEGEGADINGVSSVSFEFDAGYTDIQNLKSGKSQESLIKAGNTLKILGCEGRQYKIYNLEGSMLSEGVINSGAYTIGISDFQSGNYILRVGKSILKFNKK